MCAWVCMCVCLANANLLTTLFHAELSICSSNKRLRLHVGFDSWTYYIYNSKTLPCQSKVCKSVLKKWAGMCLESRNYPFRIQRSYSPMKSSSGSLGQRVPASTMWFFHVERTRKWCATAGEGSLGWALLGQRKKSQHRRLQWLYSSVTQAPAVKTHQWCQPLDGTCNRSANIPCSQRKWDPQRHHGLQHVGRQGLGCAHG